MLLGSHEYILGCNQAVAMQVVLRHGLDAMFNIAWDVWSAKVLPAVMDLKAATHADERQRRRGLHEGLADRRVGLSRQEVRSHLRHARTRRRHHDVQPMRRRR